jgi:hypothetical protein
VNTQTEMRAGIVSSLSSRDKSAAVAFCNRYEDDSLYIVLDMW